jgi:hypothetical protein
MPHLRKPLLTFIMKRSVEPLFVVLAVLLGIGSGYMHVIIPDPTIVALAALASAMFLGFARPPRRACGRARRNGA